VLGLRDPCGWANVSEPTFRAMAAETNPFQLQQGSEMPSLRPML